MKSINFGQSALTGRRGTVAGGIAHQPYLDQQIPLTIPACHFFLQDAEI